MNDFESKKMENETVDEELNSFMNGRCAGRRNALACGYKLSDGELKSLSELRKNSDIDDDGISGITSNSSNGQT
ncbi:hypothetical protein A3Q56_01325 [Intoshia linei]|uniref:Uncharacterized protein n=1 Tax=Intoshia linei TaxID=1819745 RepID=A0A177B9I9_9BILA|nr:hypothetical protein A3Q56_01325 [Intoshia linei]